MCNGWTLLLPLLVGAAVVSCKRTTSSSVNTDPAPSTAPAVGVLNERVNMIRKSQLRGLQVQTADDLNAAYSGITAPGASPLNRLGDNATSTAYGIAGPSYSDSRFGNGSDFVAKARSVGRLLTRFAGVWYLCTATIINKSLLVTAAHCVFKYGQQGSGWPDLVDGHSQVYFQPFADNGVSAKFGDWWAAGLRVPTVYFDGTDTCAVDGIICNNDVALVWLKKNAANKNIGDVVGRMNYGWNSFGFTEPAMDLFLPTAPASAAITQFGYPAAFDSGRRMQISTGGAFQMTYGDLKNTVRGTAMTGGSSGGPWVVNFGVDATVSNTDYGLQADRNIVVAVVSWGFVDLSYKLQGASFFGINKEFPSSYGTRGSGNIGSLVFDACDSTSGWKLKSLGLCL